MFHQTWELLTFDFYYVNKYVGESYLKHTTGIQRASSKPVI